MAASPAPVSLSVSVLVLVSSNIGDDVVVDIEEGVGAEADGANGENH